MEEAPFSNCLAGFTLSAPPAELVTDIPSWLFSHLNVASIHGIHYCVPLSLDYCYKNLLYGLPGVGFALSKKPLTT